MANKELPVYINLCDEYSIGYTKQENLAALFENMFSYSPFTLQLAGARIGAETCGFLFSELYPAALKSVADSIREISGNANLPINLVTPVIDQSVWEKAEKLILQLLDERWIDAVTVNDLGVLWTIVRKKSEDQSFDKKIILGRYFDKRFRDPRIAFDDVLREETDTDSELWRHLMDKSGILGVEKECFGEIPPHSFVHFPYTLMSSGQFCEYSGIGKAEEGRFQTGRCHMQCMGLIGRATHNMLKQPLVKSKNALYMKLSLGQVAQDIFAQEGISLIYTEL